MSDHGFLAMVGGVVEHMFNVVEQPVAGLKVARINASQDTLLDGVANSEDAPL